jgi:hypothetical protein
MASEKSQTYAAVCLSSLGEILFKPSALFYLLALMDQIFPVLAAFALALALELPRRSASKLLVNHEIRGGICSP